MWCVRSQFPIKPTNSRPTTRQYYYYLLSSLHDTTGVHPRAHQSRDVKTRLPHPACLAGSAESFHSRVAAAAAAFPLTLYLSLSQCISFYLCSLTLPSWWRNTFLRTDTVQHSTQKRCQNCCLLFVRMQFITKNWNDVYLEHVQHMFASFAITIKK